MNSGKRFENSIKNSIPLYCLYYRLPDPSQAFNKNDKLRFSRKNPCDIFLFDSIARLFYSIELKTTKNGIFTFEDINIDEKQPSKMIHKHQIVALEDFSKFNNLISGFIFNFRYEKQNTEITYFQSISDFLIMANTINKKSFNEKDLLRYNPININGYKKRVNYTWDIDTFLLYQKEKYFT
ncbi:hypothetical protein LJC58_03870 [Lachnospiraceae bacterium OttesenSCG-928-D06]|nr:hypothetical protein [Lachnospiraceae bacterium OttesenSCG-928-D06]